MAAITIPESRLDGFIRLSELSSSDAEAIAKSISEGPIEKGPSGVAKFIAENVQIEDAKDIVRSIISTISLIPQYDTLEELADEFVDSYSESVEDTSEENLQNLRNNLLIVWKPDTLKRVYKSSQLFRHEDHIYRNAKIVSDIRLMFNDELTSKERSAIILHDLKINYYVNDGEEKAFHASLSYEDLKNLKTQIERAMEKEEVIKGDYTSIHFMPPSL